MLLNSYYLRITMYNIRTNRFYNVTKLHAHFLKLSTDSIEDDKIKNKWCGPEPANHNTQLSSPIKLQPVIYPILMLMSTLTCKLLADCSVFNETKFDCPRATTITQNNPKYMCICYKRSITWLQCVRYEGCEPVIMYLQNIHILLQCFTSAVQNL